ncbi:TPA: DUF2971 domain-containing protein [Citrobacter freundii]|nr:DUF2971 domain-containing protein [Citrobacter freundii]
MILYKYIDAKSLNFIFLQDTLSIKFNPIGKFNDPFESYGACLATTNDENSLLHLTLRHAINNELACLCLSKDPLSVLMWSHYADSHSGYVVGIDTEIAGFENSNECVITASEGDISYYNDRKKESLHVDENSINDKETIIKILLNKSIHWKYEEETRIIKRVSELTNKDSHFLHEIKNINAIKEIYIGIKNETFQNQVNDIPLLHSLILNNEIELFKCEFKSGTWDLKQEDYSFPMENDFRISYMDAIEKVVKAIHRNDI